MFGVRSGVWRVFGERFGAVGSAVTFGVLFGVTFGGRSARRSVEVRCDAQWTLDVTFWGRSTWHSTRLWCGRLVRLWCGVRGSAQEARLLQVRAQRSVEQVEGETNFRRHVSAQTNFSRLNVVQAKSNFELDGSELHLTLDFCLWGNFSLFVWSFLGEALFLRN